MRVEKVEKRVFRILYVRGSFEAARRTRDAVAASWGDREPEYSYGLIPWGRKWAVTAVPTATVESTRVEL